VLFKLEHNRNYAFLFFIIIGLPILSVFIFGEAFSALLFFLSFYFLGILQLYSGVALNRQWTAEYKKEDHPFVFWTVIILSFAGPTFGLIMLFLSSK